MSEIKIPKIGSRISQQVGISGGFVQPSSAGYNFIDKRVVLGTALPATGSGLEISIPEAGEIAIFGDRRFDIALEQPSFFMSDLLEARFTGRITKLFIRARDANQIGNVVIFSGRPNLGSEFKREDISKISPLNKSAIGAIWNNPNDTIGIPISFPTDAGEAFYLIGVSAKRSVGSITGISYLSTSPSNQLFKFQAESPTDIFSWAPPIPIRITNSGNLNFHGDIGPTASIEYDIFYVGI